MNARRTMLVAALLGVGISALFFMFLLSPKLAEIRDTREQIEAERAQTDRLNAEIRRLEEIRSDAPRTTAKLATVTNYLPSSPDLPGFIRMAQSAANRAGVELRSIGPSAPTAVEDAEGIDVIGVTLTIRGSFARVEDLLVRLEELERVLQVTSLALTPVQDEVSGALVLDGTIQGRMYVVQPNAQIDGSGGGEAATVRREGSS